MTPRIHTMAPLTRRMSEARRNQVHGPLLPMDDKLPGDGDLAHIGLLICMASAGLTLFTLWSIFA